MKKVQTAILIFLSCILAAAGIWCVCIAVDTINEEEKIADYEKEIKSLQKEEERLEAVIAKEQEKDQQGQISGPQTVKMENLDSRDKKEAEKKEKKEKEEKKKTEEKEPDSKKKEKTAEEKDAEKKAEEIQKNGKKIAIDPGHQGPNVDMSELEPVGPGSEEMKAKASSGTQGSFTGVPEYELNLNISKQLREELIRRGYEVVLTREDHDTAISNSERATMAVESGANIYVRIHANGSDDSGVNGAMTMIPSAENIYVGVLHDKSYALGESIINAYCEASGMKNDGVQVFDNMTGINWSRIPVTILEMGFMTNEQDDTNMQNPEYQVRMVQGIADGIDRYFAAGN